MKNPARPSGIESTQPRKDIRASAHAPIGSRLTRAGIRLPALLLCVGVASAWGCRGPGARNAAHASGQPSGVAPDKPEDGTGEVRDVALTKSGAGRCLLRVGPVDPTLDAVVRGWIRRRETTAAHEAARICSSTLQRGLVAAGVCVSSAEAQAEIVNRGLLHLSECPGKREPLSIPRRLRPDGWASEATQRGRHVRRQTCRMQHRG